MDFQIQERDRTKEIRSLPLYHSHFIFLICGFSKDDVCRSLWFQFQDASLHGHLYLVCRVQLNHKNVEVYFIYVCTHANLELFTLMVCRLLEYTPSVPKYLSFQRFQMDYHIRMYIDIFQSVDSLILLRMQSLVEISRKTNIQERKEQYVVFNMLTKLNRSPSDVEFRVNLCTNWYYRVKQHLCSGFSFGSFCKSSQLVILMKHCIFFHKNGK